MNSVRSAMVGVLLAVIFSIHHVECGYVVSVTFRSVSNPNGILAIRRHCDPATLCDSYVAFCLRPNSQAIDTVNTYSNIFEVCRGDGSEVITTVDGYMQDTESVSFNDSVFGRPNPVLIHGPPPEATNGLILYLEFLDNDPIGSGEDLIDRFAIELSPPINSLNLTQTEYHGIFEVAKLGLGITAACETGFIGQNCNITIWAAIGPILFIVIAVLVAIVAFAICKIRVKHRKTALFVNENPYATLNTVYSALQQDAPLPPSTAPAIRQYPSSSTASGLQSEAHYNPSPQQDGSTDSDAINCAPCIAYSPNPSHIVNSRKDDNIQEKTENADVIQCVSCPAYESTPDSGDTDAQGRHKVASNSSNGNNIQEKTENADAIQCVSCPAYKTTPDTRDTLDTRKYKVASHSSNGNSIQEKTENADAIQCVSCPAYVTTPDSRDTIDTLMS